MKALKRKLFLSVASLAVCAATLVSTTFAWYTSNSEVSASGLNAASAASTDARVVIGRNFVGGVIGRAYNNYSMKNITSNINVSSTYTSTSDNIYSEGISSLTRFSYAGGIAGFLGTGEGSNFEINNTSSIQGSRAGFAVGGIGQGANIDFEFSTLHLVQVKTVFGDVLISCGLTALHYYNIIIVGVSNLVP